VLARGTRRDRASPSAGGVPIGRRSRERRVGNPALFPSTTLRLTWPVVGVG
jgi:hypothetical protein